MPLEENLTVWSPHERGYRVAAKLGKPHIWAWRFVGRTSYVVSIPKYTIGPSGHVGRESRDCDTLAQARTLAKAALAEKHTWNGIGIQLRVEMDYALRNKPAEAYMELQDKFDEL